MGRTTKPKTEPPAAAVSAGVSIDLSIDSSNKASESDQSHYVSGSVNLNIDSSSTTTTTAVVNDNSSNESKFIRIENSLIVYSSDKDQVRNHGTGRECIENLGRDGKEAWNKWFTGKGNDMAVVTMQLSTPHQVHQYSLITANDQPGR